MMITEEQHEPTAIERFIEALEEYQDIYQQLIETAQEKHEMILAGQDHELRELVSREHELLQRFSLADQARKNAVATMQQKWGMPIDENQELTEIINLLDEQEEQARLQDIQIKLREASQRLQTLNEQNLVLLKQDVALIQDLLDGILGPAESDYVYEHPGSGTGTAKRTSGIDYRM